MIVSKENIRQLHHALGQLQKSPGINIRERLPLGAGQHNFKDTTIAWLGDVTGVGFDYSYSGEGAKKGGSRVVNRRVMVQAGDRFELPGNGKVRHYYQNAEGNQGCVEFEQA